MNSEAIDEFNKIVEAAQTIQECCMNAIKCSECPFDNGQNGCGLESSLPKDWNIKPRRITKVFSFER